MGWSFHRSAAVMRRLDAPVNDGKASRRTHKVSPAGTELRGAGKASAQTKAQTL